VTTIITTTGFSTADYITWGTFYTLLLMLLMFFGGCGGSTSGGAKIDRMVILAKHARNELYRVLHPNAIRPVLYNGKVLPQEIVSKVLSFTVFYVLTWVCGAVLLSITGVTLGEAVGCALTCLSNVGPGLGVAGPSGTFAPLPDIAKWILSAMMLIGRLEIFTALIIFTPMFWRNS
jgi:trk system potassium uptake protein TrkH